MKVSNFTTVNYVNLSPSSTIRETIAAFLEHKVDFGCITKNLKLMGIVHKNSIYRTLLSGASLDTSVKSLMIKDVVTIHKDQTLYEARDIMVKGNVSQAVVLDHNQEVYGIMSKSDLVSSHMAALDNAFTRMTSLVENLQDAVISVDDHLKIITYNSTAIDLLDLNGKHLIDAPIDRFLPPFRRWLIETIKSGEIQDAKRITFQSLTVIASFIPIKEVNNVTGAMVVLRDVTSYENIANELESTKKLKKILDSALELAYDGVVITDNEGKITMVNKGFMELYEINNQVDVIGVSINKIAPQIPAERSLIYNENMDGELIKITGQQCIVTQMPIVQNGRKLGAIFKIIFRQLDSWKDILQKMEKLESEISYYRGELYRISKENDPFAEVVTLNATMKKFKQEAAIAAKSLSNVLITGESGTGKELFAEGIHHLSGRKGAFIKVNCGAIPEELLESEFFGYADGAFTGAKKGGKPGKFELADNGTLFLDEIGDMPLSLQVKLLRVLQEQEFERIGATKTTKVNVRIISATNKDLTELVKLGKFREDLFYRIHVIHLQIPPLRNRLDDIPLLCKYFIEKINNKTNKEIVGTTAEVVRIFQQYTWPGNIRQLENVLERAFHYSQSEWIEVEHLPKEFLSTNTFHSNTQQDETKLDLNRKESINQTEKNVIIQALKKSSGNRTKAANLLGISRTTLYQKMRKYRIKEELEYRFTSS
ncbi:sigma 54-interacting transcriptional regulator [Mesobacillus maritimus]|uniref:sigma 54-interacting transcriptional regulator n=1 Tax=Mesobacillus maritimus TaxID=1643336 RepID=UPI00203E6C8B|nr:sigma 54-interacting transcriptional regulator [Mesobacillus maritimus]MCM3584180.1 sigma 54-interacting transcriptional regulator [Mesobacillus maritimus]MCM3669358.1 sigma 54-interacting transcriptional regulator [Mesobacillus maritimus]